MNKRSPKSKDRPRSGAWRWVLPTVFALVVVIGGAIVWRQSRVYTDGLSVHQPVNDAVVRFVLWEDPQRLAGVVNETDDNYEPTFSADGRTLIFTRGRAASNADLFTATLGDGGWSDIRPITSLNSEADELGPELSRDGRYLYFYSNRDGGFGGYDLYVSRWDGHDWSSPTNLGPTINTAFNEYGPGLNPSTGELYFSSNRPKRELTEAEKRAWKATLRELLQGVDYDIFVATPMPIDEVDEGEGDAERALPPAPAFAEAGRVDALNSNEDDGQVAITPRGEFIYFSSNRRGGEGGFDLYRVRVIDGAPRRPENLGPPVNTPGHDMDPALTMEGYRLVFSSNREPRIEDDGVVDDTTFLLYHTVSREVFAATDTAGLWALLALLNDIKWWLLLLVASLVALWWLMRLWQRSAGAELSLAQRCMVASLMAHLLLALLLSMWVITHQLIIADDEPEMEAAIDSEALAQEKLALEIREAVTELAAAPDTLVTEQPTETLPLPDAEPLRPTDQPIADPFLVEPTAVKVDAEPPQPKRVDQPQLQPAPVRKQFESFQPMAATVALEQRRVDAEATEAVVEAVTDNAAPAEQRPQEFAADTPTTTTATAPTESPPQPTSSAVATPASPAARPTPAIEPLPYVAREPVGLSEPIEFASAIELESTRRVEPQRDTAQVEPVQSSEQLADIAPLAVDALGEVAPPSQAEAPREVASVDPRAVVFEPSEAPRGPQRPSNALPQFRNRAEPLAEAPSLRPPLDLPTEREVARQADAPAVERLEADAPIAEAKADAPALDADRPAAKPTVAVADTETPKPIAADVAAKPVEREAPKVTTTLAEYRNEAKPLDAPPTPQPALKLATDRAVEAEQATPGVERVERDAPVAKAAMLNRADAKPTELAMAHIAEPLGPLELVSAPAPGAIDFVPRRPALSGPGDRITRRVESLDVDIRYRLESKPTADSHYMLRQPRLRRRVLDRLGGSEETEASVARALDWFSRNQEADGRWSISKHGGQKGHDIAATAFALLCYYGWGANHIDESSYRETVDKALTWLIAEMKIDGDLTGKQHNGMYDQGIATLALAEAYGLTKDPALKAPLEKAVRFIIGAQNKGHGGWRYRPGAGDGDTSVVGWQVMALRSAQLAGIEVPEQPFELSRKWLDRVGGGKHRGLYGYTNPSPKPAMVAEGMFCQQLMGMAPAEPRMIESAQYITTHLPGRGDMDLYYVYYGCLSMYQHQGGDWEKWNERVRPVLVSTQKQSGDQAGSWDPAGQYGNAMGRVVATAMATLSLEVYYRYLPLYQPLAPAGP